MSMGEFVGDVSPEPPVPTADRPLDERIKEEVCAALEARDDVDTRDVDVDVDGSVVTLQGTVATEAERAETEDTVRTCAGVRGVTNRLGIRTGELLPPDVRERDAETRDRGPDRSDRAA